jgi:hypothetical protein
MRRRRVVAVGIVAGTVWVACSFSTPIEQVAIDAPPPDAGPCMEAPTFECAGQTTLRKCVTVGVTPTDEECNWGCERGTAVHHCGTITPAGGGATAADADPTTFGALGDIVIDAMTTIDGTAGTITTVTAGFTRELRATNTIAVFRMKSLTINAPVKLTGAAAIVFVTDGPIVINAIVDARGVCGIDDNAALPGPGGFPGGVAATDNGSGSGGGKVGVATGGGGGGGFGGSGGSGGTGAALQIGGAGGVTNGTETIDLLFGGGGGGATAGGGGHARGGGGGGAVQLVSNTKIVLMSDGINAGGCGGDSGNGGGDDGGGGGGAGGAILLEAPSIEGPGALAVNGGGGGAGDNAVAGTGNQASLDRVPAAGAQGSTTGGSGGPGGAGATYAGTKGIDDLMHAGGGGGGVGRIRLNTRSGGVLANGVMSPGLGDANSTCTAGSANVQ